MPEGEETTGGLKYKVLSQVHPDFDGAYLERLWALYDGGKALLRNPNVMRDIFYRHREETDTVYQKRAAMAFYVGVAGEIIDQLVATLMSDPIVLTLEGEEEAVPLPEWYQQFLKNVTPKGAKKIDIGETLRNWARSLLVAKDCWVRVDMPAQGEFASRSDQEKAGALDAFIVHVPTACVVDWEEDEGGNLELVIVHSCESKRAGIGDTRDKAKEIWTCYTRDSWERYEFTHDKDKPIEPETVIPKVAEGTHKLGSVPFIRKVVCKGLWAMDTLEGLAREHFNKRCALSWAEFQSLLPELYEFLGPEESTGETIIGENQKNARRAIAKARGQGYVQERGQQDDAKFVGPDVAPFTEARKSGSELRDDMYRALHLMAMSLATTASQVGRSAASKEADQAATNIVAAEIGRYLKEMLVGVVEMISKVRGEVEYTDKWQATGAENFSATNAATVVERAGTVALIPIKSPTFHRINQAMVAEAHLGDKATSKVMKVIEGELAKNVTDEDMDPLNTKDKVDLGGKDKKAEAEEEDEGESEDT